MGSQKGRIEFSDDEAERGGVVYPGVAARLSPSTSQLFTAKYIFFLQKTDMHNDYSTTRRIKNEGFEITH